MFVAGETSCLLGAAMLGDSELRGTGLFLSTAVTLV